ncbi:hypothetical protein L0Z32_30055, partial [Burkholderia multivorans]|nr:hypothetical protein [Burkholderia multivorans]
AGAPTFSQLAAIAEFLGGSRSWLQHGDGRMFEVGTDRLSEDSGEAVAQLLNLHQAARPTTVHLVREADEVGRLFIIQQYGEWKCQTWKTPIHVSDHIGAGGEKGTCMSVGDSEPAIQIPRVEQRLARFDQELSATE